MDKDIIRVRKAVGQFHRQLNGLVNGRGFAFAYLHAVYIHGAVGALRAGKQIVERRDFQGQRFCHNAVNGFLAVAFRLNLHKDFAFDLNLNAFRQGAVLRQFQSIRL